MTNLTRITLSGSCATDDASLSSSVNGKFVDIASPSPGDCGVKLTFATGFTYSTTFSFASETSCGGTFVLPTPSSVDVNNPSDTCINAGAEAEGDAGADVADQ